MTEVQPGAPIPEPTALHNDARTETTRKFAVEVAKLAANTRCSNVVVLDVRGLSPITDFFVLATGTSPRQMRAVTDQAAEIGPEHGFAPLSQSGMDGESWMLIDFIDVVMHIFSPESRNFYDLDNLWGDATKVEWQPNAQAPAEQQTSPVSQNRDDVQRE
jgi:ribosome-associated protein